MTCKNCGESDCASQWAGAPSCEKPSKSLATDGSTPHVPDRSRLPVDVQRLDWQQHKPGDAYYDNDTLLVAVSVRDSLSPYELAVISALDNGDYLDWYCHGELWEWAIDDVDFFVRIGA